MSKAWLGRAWQKHCEAGWTAWLRLLLPILFGVIGWCTHQCFVLFAAGAMVFLHLATYTIVGIEESMSEKEVSKATYDGINLSMHVLVATIAAVLGLVIAFGKPAGDAKLWVSLAGAAGIGFGVWGLMLLAEPTAQQGTKIRVKWLRWCLARFFWWIQLFSLFIVIGFLVV